MLMLENKTALVTGAGRGIGRAVCRKLASEGAVVYAGVRDACVGDGFRPAGGDGHVIPVQLDVCDPASIRECVGRIRKEAGKTDILVNNAGITVPERLEMVTDAAVKGVYGTNVFGLLNVTKAAMRLLRKSDSPCIVNMSSVMAKESDVGQTVYAGAKAAVESMTRTWAKEYSPMGIRVNAVAPGHVNTDMFNVISEDGRKAAISRIGLGRIAEPDEIANVVLFLASDMAGYVTGEVIDVNGGLVL